MQILEITKFHGTPPRTLIVASSGKLIASNITNCSSLLKSLPVTIWKLLMGVVIRTLSVPVWISSLTEELSITIAISWAVINWNHERIVISCLPARESLEAM
jgi:hypothetical protein